MTIHLIVFQDFQLLSEYTVYENLDFVLRVTDWEKTARAPRIAEVLQQVGISEKANNYPHELSGGEQQRVAIARALLNAPKIILADEPTGALDSTTGKNILKLLKNLAEHDNFTVVIVTHNANIAHIADHLIRIADGKIIADELIENPKSVDEVEW